MARFDELPLWLRGTLRVYPWRRVDPVPSAPLRKPLAACRVALVTTGGLVPPGGEPFDVGVKGGDFSYRMIPAEIDVATLGEFHRSAYRYYTKHVATQPWHPARWLAWSVLGLRSWWQQRLAAAAPPSRT